MKQPFAWTISTAACLAFAAPGVAAEATQLAGCAGVADAAFDRYHSESDTEYLDNLADEAYIFFALARHSASGELSAELHLDRLYARRELARLMLLDDMASEDDAHTLVQACSDLRQALAREGEFNEPPRQ